MDISVRGDFVNKNINQLRNCNDKDWTWLQPTSSPDTYTTGDDSWSSEPSDTIEASYIEECFQIPKLRKYVQKFRNSNAQNASN
jgi:hypothetical protein